MHVFTETLTFLASISILSLASQLVVRSALKLARITRLGEVVIGFLMIALATSLPELSVAISSVTSGNIGITIGDLLGSNVTNVCLIIALMSILGSNGYIKIRRKEIKSLSSMLFLSSLIPIVLLGLREASGLVGAILIFLYFYFCYYSMKRRITLRERKKKKNHIFPAFLSLLIGLAILVISANFVVESAANLSELLGIAQSVLGATIVAFSTSLPELSVMIFALRERRPQLSLGDTIGSCLTNLMLVLGLVLILSPFSLNMTVFSTIIFFIFLSSILLWYFIGDGKLNRLEGILLLSVYIFFILTTYGILEVVKFVS